MSRFKPGDLALVIGLRSTTEWNGRIVTVASHVFRVAEYGGAYVRGPTEVVWIEEHRHPVATFFLIPLPGDDGSREELPREHCHATEH